jgi:DNA-binding response OmpR family regulator
MVNSHLQATEEDMTIARTLKEQEQLIQMLDAGLLAAGVKDRPQYAPWMTELNPQERALVGALYTVYPRLIARTDLLEYLPSPGRDELDRQPEIVNVIVCKARKKLGFDAIENQRGIGFKLGDEFYINIPKKQLDTGNLPD